MLALVALPPSLGKVAVASAVTAVSRLESVFDELLSPASGGEGITQTIQNDATTGSATPAAANATPGPQKRQLLTGTMLPPELTQLPGANPAIAKRTAKPASDNSRITAQLHAATAQPGRETRGQTTTPDPLAAPDPQTALPVAIEPANASLSPAPSETTANSEPAVPKKPAMTIETVTGPDIAATPRATNTASAIDSDKSVPASPSSPQEAAVPAASPALQNGGLPAAATVLPEPVEAGSTPSLPTNPTAPPAGQQTHPASLAPAPATAAAMHVVQQTAAGIATAHSFGPQRVTIRLSPPELGNLQIRIDRPPDAPAAVEIKVQHTQTLDLLLHDQRRLHQALDQAGVPPEGRNVVFTLDNPGDQQSSSRQERSGRNVFGEQTIADTEPEQLNAASPIPVTWSQGGLDITA